MQRAGVWGTLLTGQREGARSTPLPTLQLPPLLQLAASGVEHEQNSWVQENRSRCSSTEGIKAEERGEDYSPRAAASAGSTAQTFLKLIFSFITSW